MSATTTDYAVEADCFGYGKAGIQGPSTPVPPHPYSPSSDPTWRPPRWTLCGQYFQLYWTRHLPITPTFDELGYSPNPDFGETGPDTLMWMSFGFRPSGDAYATDVRLRLTVDDMINPVDAGWEQPEPLNALTLWGSKWTNPQPWGAYNGPTWQRIDDPNKNGETTPWVRVDFPVRTVGDLVIHQVTLESPNIADLYNELVGQTGFTPGNLMFFTLTGDPIYGDLHGEAYPGSAVLRVTTDPSAIFIPAGSLHISAPPPSLTVSTVGTILITPPAANKALVATAPLVFKSSRVSPGAASISLHATAPEVSVITRRQSGLFSALRQELPLSLFGNEWTYGVIRIYDGTSF